MTGATILTTPFESEGDTLDKCIQVLHEKLGANLEDLKAILDLLELKTVVNLCQV